jgi:hypothetical protein
LIDLIRDLGNRFADLGDPRHIGDAKAAKIDDYELTLALEGFARLGITIANAFSDIAENLDRINLDTRATQPVAEIGQAGLKMSEHARTALKEYQKLYEAQRKARATGVVIPTDPAFFAKTA